jgi:hypothetical protein
MELHYLAQSLNFTALTHLDVVALPTSLAASMLAPRNTVSWHQVRWFTVALILHVHGLLASVREQASLAS